MAYARRHGFRKSRFLRRRFRFRGRRFRRAVKRTLVRLAETKIAFKTNNFTAFTAANNAAISFVDGLATGVGSFNRLGNKIMLKRLSWRIQVRFLPNASGIPDALFRVALIFPRKTIANDKLSGIQATSINSSYDPQLVYVAYDRVFGLGQQIGVNPDMPSQRLIRHSRHVKNMVIRYASATDNDVEREPLLLVSTSIPSGDASSLQVLIETRISYTDA